MSGKIRAFPETRTTPRWRVLAIPFVLTFGGFGLMLLHESLRFIGAVISLTGVITIFLVGMVFADLWSASHRTKDIINAREKRQKEDEEIKTSENTDGVDESDPFLDTLED